MEGSNVRLDKVLEACCGQETRTRSWLDKATSLPSMRGDCYESRSMDILGFWVWYSVHRLRYLWDAIIGRMILGYIWITVCQ